MADKKITISAEFLASLKGMDSVVSKMKQGLAEANKDFSKTNNFSKLFTQYADEYRKLQTLMGSGEVSLIDSKEVLKSGEKVVKLFRQISTEYGDLGDMDVDLAKKLFPKEFTEAAKKAGEAIKSFEKSSEILRNQEDLLDKAQKKMGELERAAASAAQKLSNIDYTPQKAEEARKKLAGLTEEHEKLENHLKQSFEVDSVTALNKKIEQNEKEVLELEKAYKRATSAKKDFEQAGQTKDKAKTNLDQAQKYSKLSKSEKIAAQNTNSENHALYQAYQASGVKSAQDWVAKAQREVEAWAEIDKLPDIEKKLGETQQLETLSDKYTDVTKSIKEQKTEVEALNKSSKAYFSAVSEKEEADAKYEQQRQAVENLKKNIDELKNKDASLDKLFETLNSIGANPEGLEATAENLDKIKQSLGNMDEATKNRIVENLKAMGLTAEEAERKVEELRAGFSGFGQATKEISEAEREMENLKNQVLQFFSIGNAIELFKRAVRDALNTVKELDAVMTETAVVTDFSIGDMWEKLPQYSKEASVLGASIKDLYGATTLYYQQGLKTEAAMGVGIETMKMARIANMEASDATQAMTAALRGFNMEVDEMNAQRVNDVYSELAAVTAADTNQIAKAMGKTASIAASANMEFETTAALLAQIIETTQEAPETAGTAMKTIIARFTEVKELFSEGMLTGEDEEGEEININKIDAALKTVGISLKDFLNGSKGIDDIFLELASKWDGLDLATQRYIATMAAGSRQQSRFIAMMSNYGRTMELVNAANNSAGASQEQFSKTLDSMEAKSQQLKNAWDQFVMGLANDQILKGAITTLTAILKVINRIIDKISGGNGMTKSVLTLMAAITALKGAGSIFKKIFTSEISKTAIMAFRDFSEQAGNGGTQGGEALRRNLSSSLEQVQMDAFVAGQGISDNLQRGIDSNPPEVRVNNATNPNIPSSGDKGGSEKSPTNSTDKTNLKQVSRASLYTSSAVATLTGTLFNYIGAGQKASNENSVLGTSFQAAGTAATAAGFALSSFGPALVKLVGGLGKLNIYLGLVVVAVGLLAAAFQAIKNNSPEGKLEAAQKASEKAAEAADGAAEAYANLSSSLDSLSGKEANLEGLIQGTKEWRDAVAGVNNEVLSLIEKYPALGAFVESKDGVLGFNKEKTNTQGQSYDDVLKGYEQAVQNTRIAKIMADIDVQKEQEDTTIANAPQVVIWRDSRTGEEISNEEYRERNKEFIESGFEVDPNLIWEASEERTEQYAREIADGSWEKEGSSSREYLLDQGIIDENNNILKNTFYEFQALGQSLLSSDDAIDGFTIALINSAKTIADVTPEQSDTMEGAYTSEMVDQRIESEKTNITNVLEGEDTKEIDKIKQEYAKAMGYAFEDGKFYSGEAGNRQEVTVLDQDIASGLAGVRVTNNIAEDMKAMAPMLDDFAQSDSGTVEKAIANVFDGIDGTELTSNDLTEIQTLLSGAKITKDEEGNLTSFGNVGLGQQYENFAEQYTPEEFLELVSNAFTEGSKREKEAQTSLSEAGITSDVLSQVGNLTLSSMATNISKASSIVGQEAFEPIATQINGIMDGLDPDQAELFAGALGTIDWSNAESVQSLSDILEGMNFEGSISEIEALEEAIFKAGNLFAPITKITAEAAASLAAASKKLRNNEPLSEEEYNALITQNPDIAGSFIKVGEEYYLSSGNGGQIAKQTETKTKETLGNMSEQLGRGEEFKEKLSMWKDGEERAKIIAEGGTSEWGAPSDRNFMEEYLRDIYGFNTQEMSQQSDDQIRNSFTERYNQDYGANGSMYERNKADYQEAVINSGSLDGLQDNQATAEVVDPTLTNIANNLNLDPQAIIEYKNALMETNKELSQLQAGRLAEQFANMTSAVKTISDNWDEWTQSIDKGVTALEKGEQASIDYYSAMSGLKNEVGRLLNVQGELSDEFIVSAKNSGLLERALSGSADGFNDLQKAASKDIFEGLEEAGAEIPDYLNNIIDTVADTNVAVGEIITATEQMANDSLAYMLSEMYTKAYNAAIQGGNDVATAVSIANDTIARAGYNAPKMVEKEVTVTGTLPPDVRPVEGETITGPNGEEITGWKWEDQEAGTYTYTTTMMVPESQSSGFEKVSESIGSGDFKPSGGGGGGGGGSGSEPKKWENPYDEFYNTVQKLNEELRKRNKLEREYQRLLDKTNTTGKDLTENAEKQLASLAIEKKTREELLKNRKRQMDDIEEENSQYSNYAHYNEELGVIEIDWEKIEALDGSTDEEFTKGLEEYISQLEDQEKLIEEEEDALDEIEDTVKEIRDQGKDEYFDFENQIRDALEQSRQEEIDKLSAINESINDTNARLLDAMQSSIDKYRQDRENERTEEELSDKQRRLAYLQQDTSGANDLEILQLQEEIDQGTEDYTDTLIDQKINELQEQNDKAAEQRQQQIDLLQAQLDQYLDSGEVWQDVYKLLDDGFDEKGVKPGSDLERLLMEGASFKSLSELAKMKWLEELENTVAKAYQWLTVGNSTESLLDRGELKKGQKISFTTADGKKVTGTLDAKGNVTTKSGEKYKGVYRTYNGAFVTDENYITPDPPKPAEPSKKDTEIPKLDTNTKRGVSAAIWNGNYGWGNDPYRSGRLKEVFGENDIQENYVEKYVMSGYTGKISDYSYANMKKKFKKFKTGGLADFTGPAWLDGTKSKPEYILNADQTKSFFQLVDVLGSLKSGASQSSQITGDSIYDVDINVESIGNDYDVEQLASTIKRMINDDARYRNNNAINLQR